MLQPIRLLVIEDNAADVELIREYLSEAESSTFEQVHCDRVEKAVELLEEKSFDVALLDINLPDANGLNGIRRLMEKDPELPIVVMTALDDEAFAIEAVKSGIQDYVIKGDIDGAHLQRVLRYAIERSGLEAKISYLAHHDPLTGLVNRVVFNDRLEHAISRTDRTQRSTALLLLDLDEFKGVNDNLGHQVGDELLRQCAARLQACVRTSDTVARLGGDEFAVILEDIRATSMATRVAEKIIEAISAPFRFGVQKLAISASVGIVVYPDCGINADPEKLFRCADDAMYRAKQSGKNRYRLFTEQMGLYLLNRWQLEQDLKCALERNEFVLYYQPVFGAQDGSVTSVEALLRWKHPVLGMLSPHEFLQYLEDSGDIVHVGTSMMNAICNQMQKWSLAGLPPFPVSINVSSKQVLNCGFAAYAMHTLSRYGVDPARVILDLSENRLIERSEYVTVAIGQLKAEGMHFAIDDFGIGQNSYDYLKRFPTSYIKLHPRYIRHIESNEIDSAVIESQIVLAHRLGMHVVAKGVENQLQLQRLRELRCDSLQGYLLARPLPAGQLPQFLSTSADVTRQKVMQVA